MLAIWIHIQRCTNQTHISFVFTNHSFNIMHLLFSLCCSNLGCSSLMCYISHSNLAFLNYYLRKIGVKIYIPTLAYIRGTHLVEHEFKLIHYVIISTSKYIHYLIIFLDVYSCRMLFHVF